MHEEAARTRRGSGRPPVGAASVRDALLRAAATHFSRYGYAGASTRAILADAGATAPALYHHFGNKTGLYRAAATAAEENVLDAFAAAIAGQRTDIARVSALLAAAVALRREHPNVARYLSVIQQDIARHPELSDLATHGRKFEGFWRSVTTASGPDGLALALRAVVEGLLAVGGTVLGIDDIAAAANAIDEVFRSGLKD